MILRFLAWVWNGPDSEHIAHWSEERARYYERATYRYLGIRVEPIYPWSRKLRPRKANAVMQIAERKRA